MVYIPGELIPIVLFVMTGFTIVGLPLARALARKWDRESGQPKVPAEMTARLERMEQAIDAIAIEVERISEGQRFTTRLLSERNADAERLALAESSAPGSARARAEGRRDVD
jgi:hypothetical protein